MSAPRSFARAASTSRTGAAIPAAFKASILFVLIIGTAGCTGAPPHRPTAAEPSNPAARVPPVAYRSTLGPYTSLRPAEPLSWREQNERLMPQQKP